MSLIHPNSKSSQFDCIIELHEKETEREQKESTVNSDGPSRDLMSGMKAVMMPMVKTLKVGSLTSLHLVVADKQLATSKLVFESKIIQPYTVS